MRWPVAVLITDTVLLPVLATYIRPSGLTATPDGVGARRDRGLIFRPGRRDMHRHRCGDGFLPVADRDGEGVGVGEGRHTGR